MRGKDDNAYPKLGIFSWRALIVFAVVFVLFQCLLFFLYRDSVVPPTPELRLGNPVSYAEIADKIALLKKEPRPVVAFVGASAMWGAGDVVSSTDTYPVLFAKAHPEVAVYNFSFPAARPLDILLISMAIAPYVSTTVVDVNEVHLGQAYHTPRLVDRSVYLRTAVLLKVYAGDLKKRVPEAYACLSEHGVPVKREWYVDIRSMLPVLAYKDSIAADVFGMPYAFKAGEWVGDALSAFQGQTSSIVEQSSSSTPFVLPYVAEPLFGTLNECIVTAHAAYARREMYGKTRFITPPHMRDAWTPVDAQNHVRLRQIFSDVYFADIDAQQEFSRDMFVDMGHLHTAGQHGMAERVSDIIFGSYAVQ